MCATGKDLADHTDQWARWIAMHVDFAEAVAAVNQSLADVFQLDRRIDGRAFGGDADLFEALVIGLVRLAFLDLMRARLQQHLLQNVGRDEHAPASAEEWLGELSKAGIPVLAGGRKYLHVLIATRIEDLSQERSVLAEAARTIRRRHEEDDFGGVVFGLFKHLHEIADGHFGGVAFVAGGVFGAEFARTMIRGRRDVGIDTERAEAGREGAPATVSHRRNEDLLAL